MTMKKLSSGYSRGFTLQLLTWFIAIAVACGWFGR
jgi:hypothetical protein